MHTQQSLLFRTGSKGRFHSLLQISHVKQNTSLKYISPLMEEWLSYERLRVYVCVCVCTEVEDRGSLWVFSSIVSYFSFSDKVLYWTQRSLFQIHWLDNKPSLQNVPASTHTPHWIISINHNIWLCDIGVRGPKLSVHAPVYCKNLMHHVIVWAPWPFIF